MIEKLQHRFRYAVQKSTENNPHPSIGVVSDVSIEQEALQTSIKERAHIIAENVRNYGIQKFGPIWAQGYAVLPDGRPDGRIVFLQQSLGEAKVRDALIINILPTPNDPCRIYIRYDLERDEINTYEKQEDGKPTDAYRTGIPANLTLRNIVGPVEEILQLVEIASNKIVWTKPEPTLVIPI